jgi:hypothetical protein
VTTIRRAQVNLVSDEPDARTDSDSWDKSVGKVIEIRLAELAVESARWNVGIQRSQQLRPGGGQMKIANA